VTSPDRQYWEERAVKHGRLACGYLDPRHQVYEQPLRWAAFARMSPIKLGERVLDIGCGVGTWSVRMAEQGAQVLGADISAAMIDMAEPHAGVEYRVAAAHELDCPDSYFDLVVSVTVLQHITDPDELKRALRNLRRMLNDSGRFFVLEYSPLHSVPSQELTYMRYRTHQQWIDLMAGEGFALASSGGVRFIGHRAYGAYRRLRQSRYAGPPAAAAPTPPPAAAVSPTAPSLSSAESVLMRMAQATERAIARMPLIRQRSDLHAYVFVKSPGSDAHVPSSSG
jgi:2-polyprenyl-3-methyl-5-hydroxy-6-metoxy-1,4-benzoquinol methylase